MTDRATSLFDENGVYQGRDNIDELRGLIAGSGWLHTLEAAWDVGHMYHEPDGPARQYLDGEGAATKELVEALKRSHP